MTRALPYDPATSLPPPPRRECSVCKRKFQPAYSFVYTCSIPCRDARLAEMHATAASLPAGEHDLILGDPPWPFGTYSKKGRGRSPDKHYETRDIDWIRRLPVERLAAKNAVLVLWANDAVFDEAFSVIACWGFKYKTRVLNWVKLAKSTGQPRMGLGYATRMDSEIALLATRRKGLTRMDRAVYQTVIAGREDADEYADEYADIEQAIFAPRREHSRKPDEAYTALERLYGPGVRRLELFARTRREGWVGWGDQLPPAAPAPAPAPAPPLDARRRPARPQARRWRFHRRSIPALTPRQADPPHAYHPRLQHRPAGADLRQARLGCHREAACPCAAP